MKLNVIITFKYFFLFRIKVVDPDSFFVVEPDPGKKCRDPHQWLREWEREAMVLYKMADKNIMRARLKEKGLTIDPDKNTRL